MRETFVFDRVDRLSDILFGVAAARGVIEYEPLAHQLGMQPNHLSGLLGQLSRRSVERSGPMWTALAVSARTDRPSDGFYRLARELRADYPGLTNEQLWQQERNRCYDAIPRRQRRAASVSQ